MQRAGILVPPPGIEPTPAAAEVQGLNSWTAGNVPSVEVLSVVEAVSVAPIAPSPPLSRTRLLMYSVFSLCLLTWQAKSCEELTLLGAAVSQKR